MANTTTQRRRSPQSNQKRQKSGGSKQPKSRDQEARATLERLEAKDPGLKRLLKKAYGFAVFPTVGRASLVVGGSYGKGVVYDQDEMIGYATIGQTTAGIQLGGKTLTEVLVFENEQALERFKQGKVRFAANASAVLLKAGAAATKGPEKGIKAMAYSKGGMALEASIGGQKFSFKPVDEAGEEEETGDAPQGRAEADGASRGARRHEENGGAGPAHSGSRGMRLAAAAAAAALERVKPEDIFFLIEAAHRTLRKFAEGEKDQEEHFAQGEHDLHDDEDEEHAGYDEDDLDEGEEGADAEDDFEPADQEEDEEYEEAAEYDEDEEDEGQGPEAEYDEDEYEDEEQAGAAGDEDSDDEEAPKDRRAAGRSKSGGRRKKRAKASSSRK